MSTNCEKEAIAFMNWKGFKFYYEDETGLWETIPEGTTYKFNSKEQFRFTTEELYQLYKLSTPPEDDDSNVNHDGGHDPCYG